MFVVCSLGRYVCVGRNGNSSICYKFALPSGSPSKLKLPFSSTLQARCFNGEGNVMVCYEGSLGISKGRKGK